MEGNKRVSVLFIFLIVLIIVFIATVVNAFKKIDIKKTILGKNEVESTSQTTENILDFKIISSIENEGIDEILTEYASYENINLQIEFAEDEEIINMLNSGEKYDAIWVADSIWLKMLNDSVKVKYSNSTSTNPIVFAVKESIAEKYGFKNNEINSKDIIEKIKNESLKICMADPIKTNTGICTYLYFIFSIFENTTNLKNEYLENEELKNQLAVIFSKIETSSSENILRKLFLNGDYDAIITNESSIININQELENNGQEIIYALYPKDGVYVCDSPFAYLDNENTEKKTVYEKLQNYILSKEGQASLQLKARRAWYGGVNSLSDQNIFNTRWGIDTNKYITFLNFQNTEIVENAIDLYDSELIDMIKTYESVKKNLSENTENMNNIDKNNIETSKYSESNGREYIENYNYLGSS